MAYPKYIISYLTMDTQVGSNIIWHAALGLSICRGPDQPFEMIDCYGFYSQKSSTTHPVLKLIKSCFGIGFDLSGTHGVLKREELRYLDKGIGLKGLSFDVSREQFELLIKLCQDEMAIEQQAIEEIDKLLVSQGTPKEAITAYQRYMTELLLADSEGRDSRFSQFNLDVAMGCGLSTANSHTCKSHAIGLLAKIGIDEVYIDSLQQDKLAFALPRFSGDLLTPMQLYSVGPKQSHTSKRTGITTLFRQWTAGDHYDGAEHQVVDTATKLYWTRPPEYVITEDEDFDALLSIDGQLCKRANKYISQLQQIETVLLTSDTASEAQEIRDKFIAEIRKYYQAFSISSKNRHSAQYDLKLNAVYRFIDKLYQALVEERQAELDSKPLKDNPFRLPLSRGEQNKVAYDILKRTLPHELDVYTILYTM